MEYKYEMHCHTGPVSQCGRVKPKEIMRLYSEAGYSGIVLTDHYSPLTFYNHNYFAPPKVHELLSPLLQRDEAV